MFPLRINNASSRPRRRFFVNAVQNGKESPATLKVRADFATLVDPPQSLGYEEARKRTLAIQEELSECIRRFPAIKKRMEQDKKRFKLTKSTFLEILAELHALYHDLESHRPPDGFETTYTSWLELKGDFDKFEKAFEEVKNSRSKILVNYRYVLLVYYSCRCRMSRTLVRCTTLRPLTDQILNST